MQNIENKALFFKIFILILIFLKSASTFALSQNSKDTQFPLHRQNPSSSCAIHIISSFKIIGKIAVKKKNPKGGKMYKLRLKGFIRNIGDSTKVSTTKALIAELPQGRHKNKLTTLTIKPLPKNGQMIVNFVTKPLSTLTQFLPQFQMEIVENNRLSNQCISKNKKLNTKKKKLITTSQVLFALKG